MKYKDVTYRIGNNQSLKDWLCDLELLIEEYGPEAELYVSVDHPATSMFGPDIEWTLEEEEDG